MDKVISAEEVDTESEQELHESQLRSRAYEKCIPSFTRMTRNGEVVIKFDRRLVLTRQGDDDLMQNAAKSGSVQV